MSFPLWLAGALISAIGSILSNLGVNIQKYSAMQEEKRLVDKDVIVRPYYKQNLWILGFVFVVIGSIFDFTALSLASISIVSVVGSVTLVANIFFAHFWLEEHLTRNDIIGTVLIISGAIVAVAFGDQSENSYTLSDLKRFYTRWIFIIYIIITGSIMLLLFGIIRRAEPLLHKMTSAKKQHSGFTEMGDLDSAKDLLSVIEGHETLYSEYKVLHPISYCALAGWFGSLVLLFAKSTAELIRKSASGSNQFTEGLTYVFIFAMFACIVMETHFLATAIRFFDALFVVPVFQCFFISFGAITGGIYFGEFSNFSIIQAFLYPFGFTLTLCGVYILSSRDMTNMEFDDNGMDSIALPAETSDESGDVVGPLNYNTNRRSSFDYVDDDGLAHKVGIIPARIKLRDAARRVSLGSIILAQFTRTLVNEKEMDKNTIAELAYKKKHRRSNSIMISDLPKFNKNINAKKQAGPMRIHTIS